VIPPDHDRADADGPRHAARRSLLRRWWWPAAVLATAAAVTVFTLHADGRHACVARAAAIQTTTAGPPPPARSGVAVYYDYRQGRGNCSFDQLPSDGLYASLSPPEYDDASACGATLDVHGPKGTVRVTVVDQCPGCGVGRLDLSRGAFTQIASISSGAVPITYRPVFDPKPPEPLRISVKDGSSAQSLALNVAGTGNPLSYVEVRTRGGDWRTMARRSDDYWVTDPGGDGPFDLRISDTIGDAVTVAGVALRPGVQDTRTLLYPANPPKPTSTPSTSLTTPTPPKPLPRKRC
jgi:expansin